MIEDVVKKGHISFPMIPGFDYVEDAMEMSDVHPTHSEPPNISWIPMLHFNRKLPILPRSSGDSPSLGDTHRPSSLLLQASQMLV